MLSFLFFRPFKGKLQLGSSNVSWHGRPIPSGLKKMKIGIHRKGGSWNGEQVQSTPCTPPAGDMLDATQIRVSWWQLIPQLNTYAVGAAQISKMSNIILYNALPGNRYLSYWHKKLNCLNWNTATMTPPPCCHLSINFFISFINVVYVYAARC